MESSIWGTGICNMQYTDSDTLRGKINEYVQNVYGEDENIIIFDGFDKALIGFGSAFNNRICAVYDYESCINILIEDGMSAEEAEEYFDFNVRGAYVGETTPIFISKFNPNQ